MAALKSQAVTGDLALGDAHDGMVSRWRIVISAIVGTYTPKAKVTGTTDTPVAIQATALASGSAVSTITATGAYDIDAAGFDISLTGGTSMTISATPIVG